MGISIQAYRIAIGNFNCTSKHMNILMFPSKRFFKDGNHYFSYHLHEWSLHINKMTINQSSIKSKLLVQNIIGIAVIIHMILVLANDVHPNPGPGNDAFDLTVCHANVRSIKAENKFLFLKSELANNFDIITLSETWLSNLDKTANFTIPGYQLPFRKDRNLGTECYGGVMAYIADHIGCK